MESADRRSEEARRARDKVSSNHSVHCCRGVTEPVVKCVCVCVQQAPLVAALEDKNERLQHEMNQLYKVSEQLTADAKQIYSIQVLHREAEGPGKVAIVESHLLKTKQKLTQARHEQSLDRC